MKGLEIAWRTLDQEKLDEPCIMPFVMKGSYYSRVTGLDYWQDKDSVFMTFLTQVGANLCPQIAYPYDAIGNAGEVEADWANQMNPH